MTQIFKNKEDLIRTLVKKSDCVLDVGFWGQGVGISDPNWVHSLLKGQAGDVYALDLEFDVSKVSPPEKYFKASAENFSLSKQFDVIFAGDLIEHLSNPGLFLVAAKKHLKKGGKLILTTPNCFNLFNLAEKLSKSEPTVNRDHTCYFNSKTASQLLKKNAFENISIRYLYISESSTFEYFEQGFFRIPEVIMRARMIIYEKGHEPAQNAARL